jgi:signal transduction histidine kinase/AmiR/NasT family two-component response regulator
VTEWPTTAALRRRESVLVDDLPARFPGLVCPPCPQPPEQALVLPAGQRPDGIPPVVVIAGVNAYIPLDSSYREYLDLVAEQVAAAVMAARHRQDEHDRLAALAAVDRAKSEFFAGVSHEFRTPLTLLLGPLDELSAATDLTPAQSDAVHLAQRNALRLLKLVNMLLEFALLEQGRNAPRIEAVDLAAATTDVVSVFRSAVTHAGLALVVDCPPLGRTVPVDPDMWESVVLNLVANALKHTFTGSITVALSLQRNHVELTVTDTGVGIEPAEIPHLFERFHRVRGSRARSEEGSGIGLALVHQLVHLHRGSVRVRSVVGQGTTFTVWLPLAQRRRNEAGPRPPGDDAARATRRQAFADEADLWLDRVAPQAHSTADAGPRPRVLVVDDDADLRDYLSRLLAERYDVVAVGDGQQALHVLAGRDVDLVLSDVLMPVLDGVGLLTRVRADPALRATPFILLSALADAERTARGLAAGAHDHIVKPFTARELITRIDAQLALARLRADLPADAGGREEPAGLG